MRAKRSGDFPFCTSLFEWYETGFVVREKTVNNYFFVFFWEKYRECQTFQGTAKHQRPGYQIRANGHSPFFQTTSADRLAKQFSCSSIKCTTNKQYLIPLG